MGIRVRPCCCGSNRVFYATPVISIPFAVFTGATGPITTIATGAYTDLDVDITELGLGASLHVSDVTLPENVKLVTEGERSLIAIHVPRGLVEAEAAAAEPAIVGADAKAAKAERDGEGSSGQEGAGAHEQGRATAAKIEPRMSARLGTLREVNPDQSQILGTGQVSGCAGNGDSPCGLRCRKR